MIELMAMVMAMAMAKAMAIAMAMYHHCSSGFPSGSGYISQYIPTRVTMDLLLQ